MWTLGEKQNSADSACTGGCATSLLHKLSADSVVRTVALFLTDLKNCGKNYYPLRKSDMWDG